MASIIAGRVGAPTAIDSRRMAHAIEVDELTKRFGEKIAVDDVSFSVSAGRGVGFPRPSGAGKTARLRALLGLIRPTAGSATIEGRPYSGLEDPLRAVGALLD